MDIGHWIFGILCSDLCILTSDFIRGGAGGFCGEKITVLPRVNETFPVKNEALPRRSETFPVENRTFPTENKAF